MNENIPTREMNGSKSLIDHMFSSRQSTEYRMLTFQTIKLSTVNLILWWRNHGPGAIRRKIGNSL